MLNHQQSNLIINGLNVEFNWKVIQQFFEKIVFPIALFDFETFRTLNKRQSFSSYADHDFTDKVFSVAIVIISKWEDLTIENLQKKKLKLYSKAKLPSHLEFPSFENLLDYQKIFWRFLITKLLRYHIKSLVLLGSQMELRILKNYLAYCYDEAKYKQKISYFFNNNLIFDLYDLWNRDEIINIPILKTDNSQNEIGATKKTLSLIKNDDQYWKFLQPYHTPISNNDIGRTIDQYFSQALNLLPNFIQTVKRHNCEDVVTGVAILSFLSKFISFNHLK